MKLRVAALCAFLAMPVAPVSAQPTTSPGDASKRVYDWCMKRPDGTPGECGCVSGFYAGATEDDAFRLIARMVENMTAEGGFDDEAAMVAALQEEALSQSISEERFAEIMESFATFDQLGAKSDTICVPLRGDVDTLADE